MGKMKVLLVLMGMEIGGAETHVLELAKGLKEREVEVMVASNGGVYAKELETFGIRHFRAPLHNKNLFNMTKSFFFLMKIIKKEKPDVVHAHARIPGFICALLKKVIKFNFITTAHWVFETGKGLKYLTNWGSRTIAVSDDIKEYLKYHYMLVDQNISVTINGINTKEFSPEAKGDSVISEFGLRGESTKIVYVSRMDFDRSLVAHHLIEIGEKLSEKHKNLEIVIVGGGNDFVNVKKAADKLNEKLGMCLITLAGSRTDIREFVAIADVFVGVSRAALEAMAAQKPVIVAGNEGYIGILDPDKMESAILTNFTCRSMQPSTPELLENDLLMLLFEMTEDEKKALGEFSRELMIQNYSVDKMTSDNITVYEDIIKNGESKFDVILSGYYGYKNSGDDSLLAAIIKELKDINEKIRIVVLSANPKETKQLYGIDSIYRFNYPKLLSQLKKCKLLLSGGGSLIQDVTSTQSLWYYTSVMWLANKVGLKSMLYANGVGPITKKRNRKIALRVLNKLDYITLRDKNSYDELISLGVTNQKIEITADPSINMQGEDKKSVEGILRDEGIPSDKKFIGVSIRHWKQGQDTIGKLASVLCSAAAKYDLIPLFIPMQYPMDIGVSKKVLEAMGGEGYILKNRHSVNEILGIVKECSLIVGMRLHILLYGAVQMVPVIGLAYDPKVAGFLDYLNHNFTIELGKTTENEMIEMIDNIIQNTDSIKEEMGKHVDRMKSLSARNPILAMELLEGKV